MRLTFLSSIVSERTEQAIRDRKQETGNRKQETGNRKQETGNRKQNRKKEFRKDIDKGFKLRLTFLSSSVSGRTEQETRDRKQEIGNRKQETGNRNGRRSSEKTLRKNTN